MIVLPARAPPHQVGALDGGAGRSAADDAAALQQCVQFAFDARAQVGVHQAPLPSALEPDAAGTAQRGGEGIGIGDGAVAGVERGEVPGPGFGQHTFFEPAGRDAGILLRGGDDDDGGVGAAGQFKEAAKDLRPQPPAPGHHQRTVRRTRRWRRTQRRRSHRHQDRFPHPSIIAEGGAPAVSALT